jgi:hypothetical protein
MATKRPKSTRNCPQTGPFNINFRSNLITKSKIRQKLTFLVAQVAKWCSTPQKTPNFAEHWRAKPPRLATNEESPDSKEQRTGEEPGGLHNKPTDSATENNCLIFGDEGENVG